MHAARKVAQKLRKKKKDAAELAAPVTAREVVED